MATLTAIRLGEARRIEGLRGEHSLRLMEQGILRGRSITVIRQGNPYICDLGGFRLSLSRDLAHDILVEDVLPRQGE